jgi:hypothetical protein
MYVRVICCASEVSGREYLMTLAVQSMEASDDPKKADNVS